MPKDKYNLHVGDLGVEITILLLDQNDAPLTLDDATALSITLKPPKGGAKKTFIAEALGEDPDGRIQYTTASASDLDQAGHWEIQGHVTKFGGAILHSEIGSLTVDRNIT